MIKLKSFQITPNPVNIKCIILFSVELQNEEMEMNEMAITKVRVKINGNWSNLEKDQDGKWKGMITAPAITSYGLNNKAYPVTIEVTNDAGTVKTWDNTDETWGETLNVVVRETIKPNITLITPSEESYITNNKQSIEFKIVDEIGGSGVNIDTVKIQIDNMVYSKDSAGMQIEEIQNGYKIVYALQTALEDGKHTLKITGSDHDENEANPVLASFTVDTVPPELTISYPTDKLITNNAALLIKGATNDISSSPVILEISVNDVSQGGITIESNGKFQKSIILEEGENTIIVTARDLAGKTTTIIKKVVLNSSIPQITDMKLVPNPVNTSSIISIMLEVN